MIYPAQGFGASACTDGFESRDRTEGQALFFKRAAGLRPADSGFYDRKYPGALYTGRAGQTV